MGRFTKQAQQLLELVGGRDNILTVSHCLTRLRFVLNDEGKANVKGIEALPDVKGTFIAAGQFQVIIGNAVDHFYEEFISLTGIDTGSSPDIKTAAKMNMGALERAISVLADIFVPLLPAIIAGGLILGFRNVLEHIVFFKDGRTLVEAYSWAIELNSILKIPGDAIFQFLPVGVAWSSVKRFGGSEVLGIILGIMLVSPELMNAYSFAKPNYDDLTLGIWTFGWLKIQKVGYQGQVLPAIFAGILLAKMEISLNKWIHESIRLVVVPITVILVMMFLAYTVIGPIARELSNFIGHSFEWLLAGPFKAVGAAIFGLIYAPLVITGLHHTFLTVDLILIGKNGGTMIWPMIALSNIAQGSAVFATYFIYKDAKARSISSSATISAYLGVTEPAMYGVNLKYKYPFFAAIIGTSLASIAITLLGVTAKSIGIGGLPSILSITPGKYFPFLIGMLIVIIVPFILTFVFSKTNLNKFK